MCHLSNKISSSVQEAAKEAMERNSSLWGKARNDNVVYMYYSAGEWIIRSVIAASWKWKVVFSESCCNRSELYLLFGESVLFVEQAFWRKCTFGEAAV